MQLNVARAGALWLGSLVLLSIVAAGRAEAGTTDSVVEVGAGVAGGAYDDSRTYVDRCAGFARQDDPVTETVDESQEALVFDSRRVSNVVTEGSFDGNIMRREGITYVRWWTRCLDGAGNPAPRSTDLFWVGEPRDDELVLPAYEAAMELVPAPNVSWPTKDPEFGWVYVNTSTEWRVDNLEPVSATARASNRIATAEATVTATPEWVTLLPGEPGAGIGRCTPEQAAAPFYLKIISQCSYKYKNSSAISPTSAFEAAIEVSWKVETDVVDVEPFDDLVTSWSEQLQVGEVQALVIADR